LKTDLQLNGAATYISLSTTICL